MTTWKIEYLYGDCWHVFNTYTDYDLACIELKKQRSYTWGGIKNLRLVEMKVLSD